MTGASAIFDPLTVGFVGSAVLAHALVGRRGTRSAHVSRRAISGRTLKTPPCRSIPGHPDRPRRPTEVLVPSDDPHPALLASLSNWVNPDMHRREGLGHRPAWLDKFSWQLSGCAVRSSARTFSPRMLRESGGTPRVATAVIAWM